MKSFSAFCFLFLFMSSIVPTITTAQDAPSEKSSVSTIDPASTQSEENSELVSEEEIDKTSNAVDTVPETEDSLQNSEQSEDVDHFAPEASTFGNVSAPPVPSLSPEDPDPTKFLKGLQGEYETDLFTGTATFSYPLWIPPGRNGMQPSIALQYSSTNKDFGSFTGFGWNLPRNAIYRNTSEGVNNLYEKNDFSAEIFGQYKDLISVDMTKGEYATKTENDFSRFMFTDNTWTMTDTKGTTYVFGDSIENRQTDPDDSDRIYKWMLSRVEDTNGNFMTFSYFQENGQMYPEKVRYTGHGAEQGLYEIRFVRTMNPHPQISYRSGFAVRTDFMLLKIEIYSYDQGNPNLVRTYEFDYDETGFPTNFLRSVTMKGGALSLQPIRFSYYLDTSAVGLLKKITYPNGGARILTYTPSSAYRAPDQTLSNARLPFILQTVHTSTADDGLGNPPATTSYEYSGGHYYFDETDAHTREYAGFHEVKITDPVGNLRTLYFHQSEFSADNAESSTQGEFEDHISKKGKIFREEVSDNAEHLYEVIFRKWDHEILPDDDPKKERNFPKLLRETTVSYDGNADSKATATEFHYDQYGNVTQQIDYGEVTLNGDDGNFTDIGTDRLLTNTAYAENDVVHILSLPTKLEVKDFNDTLIGETKNYYDNNSTLGTVTKGNLTKVENLVEEPSTYITTRFIYNAYGLPVIFTNSRGYDTMVEYDVYHLFPTTVTNAKNQSTTFAHDYRFGIPTEMTDPNGAKTRTLFDTLGRVIESRITDPKNTNQEITSVRYDYDTTNIPNSITTTTVFDPTSSPPDKGELEGVSYFDGFGRVIQTRTEAEDPNQYVRNSIIYDERGNIRKELLPVFAIGFSFQTINADDIGTIFTYDTMNRVATITNSVGTTSTIYDQWENRITDANGNRKDMIFDSRGNLVAVKEYLDSTAYTTSYTYDGSNNLTKITDAEGNVKNMTYDLLGRKLMTEDMHTANDTTFGNWTFAYDENGNITTRHDPKDQIIQYGYDELDRVLIEDFTGTQGVEVTYAYDQGPYAIGRMSSVILPAAEKDITYDVLGRIILEQKNIFIEEAYPETFQTAFQYDLVGNITEIIYPDGMTIGYAYNPAGQLESMRKNGEDLVMNFDYAPVGLVNRIEYVNGVETVNTYDINQLYRLTEKTTEVMLSERPLQHIAYTFDPIGNIIGITDTSDTAAAKTAIYTYDDLDRLTDVAVTNAANSQNYTHSYSYDILGNIRTKSDTGTYIYAGGNSATSFGITSNPYAVTSLSPFDQGLDGIEYTYDDNGNLTSDGDWNHTWDYQDRLMSSSSESMNLTYQYDETGARLIRENLTTGEKTIYVNRYYLLENGQQKSFIYAGDLKIATDLPPDTQETSEPIVTETVYEDAEDGSTSGWDIYDSQPSGATISNVTDPEQGRVIQLQGASKKNVYRLRQEDGADFNNISEFVAQWKMNFAESYFLLWTIKTEDELYTSIRYEPGSGECITSGKQLRCKLDPSTTAGTWQTITRDLQAELSSVSPTSELTLIKNLRVHGSGMLDDIKLLSALPGETEGSTTPFSGGIIFHHPDHLSGTNVNTDEDGNIIEILDYFPFGTVRLDERMTDYENEYKFTGKELDQDTGLYYYGARYYDAETGRFFSLDPWEGDLKNPQSLNKYAYTMNNPLRYVDITGKKVSEFQPYLPKNGKSYEFGEALGEYRGIVIYSAAERTGDGDHPFQCVACVKKFARSQYGVSLDGTGDALEYGKQASVDDSFKRNNPGNSNAYTVYQNSGSVMPQEDDIISWSGGQWGHVGFIAEVVFDEKSGTGTIYTIEQNMSRNQALFSQTFIRTYDDQGQAIYTVADRGNLAVQGWARYGNQSTEPEYTTTPHTPASQTPKKQDDES